MISVVVPIYNMEKYLARCIESLLAQTVKDLEILLIDDGSTDSSAEICKQYVQKDERIRYISKINGGLSDARNVGTVLAKGEYITYVDSDDFIHPTFMEYLLSLIKKYDADVAGCRYQETSQDFITPDLSEERCVCMSGAEACEKVLTDLSEFMTSAWGNLYKTDVVKNYRFPYGRLHEDIATTFKFYLSSNRVVFSYRKLYAYYQRPDSIMHMKSNQRIEDELWCISHRALYLKEAGEERLAYYGWMFLRDYLHRYVLNQTGTEKIWKKYGNLYVKNAPDWKAKVRMYLLSSYPNLGRKYFSLKNKSKVNH